MRTPEEIKNNILELEKELEQSIIYHSYKPLFVNQSFDSVGCFYPGLLSELLRIMSKGGELKLVHSAARKPALVKFNPQMNRIIVSDNSFINEGNILNIMLNGSGEWYIKI